MSEPINPIENSGPSDNVNPLDDPLLDAIEKSIENPPGFNDPLTENDELFMDDLAKQLGAVEASIEDISPVPHVSGPADSGENTGGDEPEMQGNEPVISGELPISDDYGRTGVVEHLRDQSDSPPPHPQESSSRMLPPNPPESRILKRGSGHGSGKKGLPKSRRTRGKTGLSTGSQMTRYCPEIREVININKCDDCEKYRHWPEGADKEPRECWYDWQEKPSSDDSYSDSDDGC